LIVTVDEHIRLDDYRFALNTFDSEPATIDFWRNALDDGTTASIGGLLFGQLTQDLDLSSLAASGAFR
jgi:hypothetical protein